MAKIEGDPDVMPAGKSAKAVQTASPERVAAFRTGISAEAKAAALLMAKGYRILAKRFRTPHGEIDIIAEHEATIVFVEVRARATAEFGCAAETVTDVKKRKVTTMAADYLARHHITNRPCRFDVVAIDDALSEAPEIVIYPNAFDAM